MIFLANQIEYESCATISVNTRLEGMKMSEETWHGIPRSKIPWYPMIDYGKCASCGKCVDYCKLGTFAFEEKNEKKRPVVKNPNNCVVLCSGCDFICPAGAITHQSKRETREIIKNLRKNYSLKRQNKNMRGQAHER
jgi:NAD-dependent dihydropyrimidine dehydrogenase PreA subunit